MNSSATSLERAQHLPAELKALFTKLPQEHRDTVCEQFLYCAQNCVAAPEDVNV